MNMRSFWWLALAFTLLWIWLQWTQFQHAKSQPPAIQQTQQASDNSVPTANPIAAPNEVPAAKGGEVPATKTALASGQRVKVKTDVYDITLDTDGGDIDRKSVV